MVDNLDTETPLLVSRLLALQESIEASMANHGPGIQEALKEEIPHSDPRMTLTLLTSPLVSSLWAIVKASYPETPVESRANVIMMLLQSSVEGLSLQDHEFDFVNVKARLN